MFSSGYRYLLVPAMRSSREESVGQKVTAITSCCGEDTYKFASESNTLANLISLCSLEQALERSKNQQILKDINTQLMITSVLRLLVAVKRMKPMRLENRNQMFLFQPFLTGIEAELGKVKSSTEY